MRPPATTIVLDAAILVAAARGRSSGALRIVSAHARLVTTDRVVHEVRRRIELGLRRPELLSIIDDLVSELTVVPVASLAEWVDSAEANLRDAVASRNGSTAGAHVLALAWSTDADVWSSDRDFAGTGVPAWSTPNLLRAIGGAVLP